MYETQRQQQQQQKNKEKYSETKSLTQMLFNPLPYNTILEILYRIPVKML